MYLDQEISKARRWIGLHLLLIDALFNAIGTAAGNGGSVLSFLRMLPILPRWLVSAVSAALIIGSLWFGIAGALRRGDKPEETDQAGA